MSENRGTQGLPWQAAALVGARLLVARLPGFAQRQADPPASTLNALFDPSRAMCHDNPATRAPSRHSLEAMAPSFIVDALTTGS